MAKNSANPRAMFQVFAHEDFETPAGFAVFGALIRIAKCVGHDALGSFFVPQLIQKWSKLGARAARSGTEECIRLGVIVIDGDMVRITNYDEYQVDTRSRDRQKRYRDRVKDRNAGVTQTSHVTSRTRPEHRTENTEHRTHTQGVCGVGYLDLTTDRFVQACYAHWKDHHPDAPKRLIPGTPAYNALSQRHSEGFAVDVVAKAFRFAHKNPWNLGKNNTGKTYLGIEYICQSGGRVTEYAEMADRPIAEGGRRQLERDEARARYERIEKERKRQDCGKQEAVGDHLTR